MLVFGGQFLAVGASADGAASRIEGWELERGVAQPSYAVTEPVETNLNIDTVVLTCLVVGRRRHLQFEIYLSASGPLMPMGADPNLLKADPRAEVAIDGHIFPMNMMFAEDFVVLADATDHRVPILSERLLDALERGRTMVLRFDLLAEHADQPAAFDGEATINLQADSAIAAVRRCASPDGPRISQEMEAARTAAASVDHLAGARKDRY